MRKPQVLVFSIDYNSKITVNKTYMEFGIPYYVTRVKTIVKTFYFTKLIIQPVVSFYFMISVYVVKGIISFDLESLNNIIIDKQEVIVSFFSVEYDYT